MFEIVYVCRRGIGFVLMRDGFRHLQMSERNAAFLAHDILNEGSRGPIEVLRVQHHICIITQDECWVLPIKVAHALAEKIVELFGVARFDQVVREG